MAFILLVLSVEMACTLDGYTLSVSLINTLVMYSLAWQEDLIAVVFKNIDSGVPNITFSKGFPYILIHPSASTSEILFDHSLEQPLFELCHNLLLRENVIIM